MSFYILHYKCLVLLFASTDYNVKENIYYDKAHVDGVCGSIFAPHNTRRCSR